MPNQRSNGIVKKYRVVHFIHGLNTGGAETLVKNYATMIDKSLFDVIVLCIERFPESPYEMELKDKGIKVIYICDEIASWGSSRLINRINNHYKIYTLIKKYLITLNPDIIHTHLPVNKYIRFSGISRETRIFYTQHFDVSRWKKQYSQDIRCLKWIYRKYPTQIIALNQDMKKDIDKLFSISTTVVVNNGIELVRYSKKINIREKRKQIGIPEDAVVIAHVGRFAKEKNHLFLLDVFKEITLKCSKAYLLLIGSGSREQDIREQISLLHLSNNVTILQNRLDVPELLLSSDAALFPSVSEGLGISLIEMQAAGLPVIASTNVPQATQISNQIQYLDLNLPANIWAEALLKMLHTKSNIVYYDLGKWDIKESVEALEKMYLGQEKNNGRKQN